VPLTPEKFAIEGSEKPGLDLRGIAQLMTFRSPEKKGLLSQISRVRFGAAELKREAIKRHVKILHQFFEVERRHFSSLIGTNGAAK